MRRFALLIAACLFLGSECDESPPCAGGIGPHETFDTLCDESVCGWGITRGEGNVESISTIHPGERGLRFSGADVTATNSNVGLMSFFGSPDVSLALSARCDAGSSLLIWVDILARPGDSAPIGVYELAVQPIQTWSTARVVTMNAEVPVPIDFSGSVTGTASVSISKVGDGNCEVDDLGLTAGFGSFCE